MLLYFLSEKCHRGMLLFVLFVLQLLRVFAVVGRARRMWAGSFFISLLRGLSQGRLCHQLSACQRRVLLFQHTGWLTFLLSLPQRSHNTVWKETLFFSVYSFALSSPQLLLSICSHVVVLFEKKWFLLHLVLHVVCLIKHWWSFNNDKQMHLFYIQVSPLVNSEHTFTPQANQNVVSLILIME